MHDVAPPPPDETTRKAALTAGFTLIELSVVLVIIGLIVGGVLVGRDLIKAAALRAQITQIERFNTATNTFRAKYGYLPGDIPDPSASSFGFQPRGSLPGQGDGNGVVEGFYRGNNTSQGYAQVEGETGTFWVDLSTAGLIEGAFTGASPNIFNNSPVVSSYFPAAKISKVTLFTYGAGGLKWLVVKVATE